jgi:precorrin-2 dehydrogenase/sirohydrochlorin ferrochelatase
MSSYYPLFLNLQSEKALVIGGGQVAERKIRTLLRYGAAVTLVSPEITAGLERLVQEKAVVLRRRPFRASDLEGVRLAICATNDEATNRKAAREAEKRSILLNVVDVPELCRFIVPAVVRRGDLTVAISTGGGSPALAKKVRQELEAHIGLEYTEFLGLLKRVRHAIQRDVSDEAQRRAIYRALIDSQALVLLRAGRRDAAREVFHEILERFGIKNAGPDIA